LGESLAEALLVAAFAKDQGVSQESKGHSFGQEKRAEGYEGFRFDEVQQDPVHE
jgi:hypothetical protein